ncbi:hypothetical protein C9374_012716 [Naegleria lovaniensis]|uniref:DH domain-containing protein n=1 Tax=Naegleria lovaniensis TaxID=51637 RepID=A0AA88H2I3_NAELO|nr:uncharacterized protein C9374_012716 [Naegleria lovaniensis]KAG2392464.1 hypothetical protein C9374_012716 [Naegleria lovaniensis]
MIVTFASNVETHYMGYIVVCPAGEKAILEKKRGGWCYIHCKLKTPSSSSSPSSTTTNDHQNNSKNNHEKTESTTSTTVTTTTTSVQSIQTTTTNTQNHHSDHDVISSTTTTTPTNTFSWGTLRVPAIYLNLDEEAVQKLDDTISTTFTKHDEDELNPLECVAYKQPESLVNNITSTSSSSSSTTTATSSSSSSSPGLSALKQLLLNSAAASKNYSTDEELDAALDPRVDSSKRRTQSMKGIGAIISTPNHEEEEEAKSVSTPSSSGARKSAHLTSLKPTKDTSNALILGSYRSSFDSAALFDQLVFNQGKSVGTATTATTTTTRATSSVSSTPMTPSHEQKTTDTILDEMMVAEQQQQTKEDQQPVEDQQAVVSEAVLDPSVTPVLDTKEAVDSNKKEEERVVTPSDVPKTDDVWQEQEDDLETFDAETETDADFILPFSKVETFDNEDFDIEDLLALSELAEMENYEPNVDQQQLELYRTKLPHFFDFDPNIDDRKKRLLHHITLQHAARKLVNVGADYDLKLAIQQGLDRARGKQTNRKATIFSGVSPLQYQEFKKFSVEEAGKLIYRVFTEWWKLKKFVNYLRVAPEFKQQRLRQSCLKEILSTERSYVNQLETLYYDFYLPMKKNNFAIFTNYQTGPNVSATNIVLRDGLTPEMQYNTIFSNIEQILKTNTALLHDLEMDWKMHWPKNHFPSIFKKILPFLKVYTVYVNNYEKANELVEELILRNPKFNEFVETVYEKKGVTLQSLLITPVQRIPRLKMLFSELLKRTVIEHVEYNVIVETLAILNELALFVNEKKRHDENNITFLRLQQILKKRFNNLVTPHRKYLKKDDFRIQCSRKFLNSNCEVYLCNDMMICIPMTADRGLRVDFAHFIFFTFSEMDTKTEEELNDEERKDFTIRTFLKSSIYTFKFEAINGTERIKWEKDLRELIDMEHTRCRKYGIKTFGTHIDELSAREKSSKATSSSNHASSSSNDSNSPTVTFADTASSTTNGATTNASSSSGTISSNPVVSLRQHLSNAVGNKEETSVMIQDRRIRLYNRSKINNSKLSSTQLRHKTVKQEMYTLSKTIREQKNQIAELEKMMRSNQEKYNQYETEFAEVEKNLVTQDQEKKTTDHELLEVDSKLMAALGNEVCSFVEIFGSDPVCDSNKEKYVRPLDDHRASVVTLKPIKVSELSTSTSNENNSQQRKPIIGGIDELKEATEKEFIVPSLALDARRTSDADFLYTSSAGSAEELMSSDPRSVKSARGANRGRKIFSMTLNGGSSSQNNSASSSQHQHSNSIISKQSNSEKRKTLLQKAKGILVGNNDNQQQQQQAPRRASSAENLVANTSNNPSNVNGSSNSSHSNPQIDRIVLIKPVGCLSPVADAPQYGLPTLPGSTNTMPSLPLFLSNKPTTTTTNTSFTSDGSDLSSSDLSPSSSSSQASPLARSTSFRESTSGGNNASTSMKSPRNMLSKSHYEDKRPFHYNRETIDSFLDADVKDHGKQQQQQLHKRVLVNPMSSLSAYEERDLDKLTFISLDKYEDMKDDEEIETTNKLYRLRPLPKWDTLEQEELNFMYKADRAVHGEEMYFKTNPLPIVIGRRKTDKLSNCYLDEESDREELEKLPDSVDGLKLLLLQMQKESQELKQQLFFGMSAEQARTSTSTVK